MKSFLQKLKNLIPSRRKILQLYFALLFNANLKGFVSGRIYKGNSKQVCVPGINCYSCPGAVGACPIGSLQGSFSADKSTIFYVGGILLLYCVLFGRMICGWLCPFGLVQELLYKIKTPKLKKSPVTRILSYFKYAVLVFFVFVVPIMYAFRSTPLPAFCKYICPAGTLEGGMGLLSNKLNESYFSMLGPLFTWKFLLMVSILAGSIFVFRLFCRFICPLGALYGLFNKISLFGIKLEKPKCTGCNLCISHCKLDIKSVGDQECISCGECVSVCPTKAISWKGPKISLAKNETPAAIENIQAEDTFAKSETTKAKNNKRLVTQIITGILMVAVLAGAIAFYWNETTIAPSPSTTPGTVGSEIGNLCPGYELELLDKNGLTGNKIDPSKTGKVTVINFWGTWCTPCVAELPYFDRLASEYEGRLDIITVHSFMVYETAPAFIASNYPDSKMIFTKDYDSGDGLSSGYYMSLGGADAYPYTVILNESGEIVYKHISSISYDKLKSIVDDILAD